MRAIVLSILLVLVSAVALSGCGGAATDLLGLSGQPVVTGVSPNPATRGSTVTITGVNLNGTLTTAYFNGSSTARATATGGNTTSVSIIVPTGLNPGAYSVHVITSDGQGTFSNVSNSVTLAVN